MKLQILNWWIVSAVILGLNGVVQAAEEPDEVPIRFETLQAGGETFTNVVVQNRSGGVMFIRHEGGFGSVRLQDLDSETLAEMGYEVVERAGGATVADYLERFRHVGSDRSLEAMRFLRSHPQLLPLAAGVIVALFFGVSFLVRQICFKVGHPPGFLIWLPATQTLPMAIAAGMSSAWFPFQLGLIVASGVLRWQDTPYTSMADGVCTIAGLVFWLFWSFKITRARRKNPLWSLLLLVPGVNVLALSYLAFSD
jgi:hypothetical protein